MARTVSEEQHTARENQVLDAAQALIYAKGYEQMTIQDILDALQMSKGALYHYYGSKQALLEAVIVRMVDQMMTALRPIVDDAETPALLKLEAVFRTMALWKSSRMGPLLALIQVWYADDNALVRDKLGRAARERFGPVLQTLIEQDIAEGVMTTDYPDLAGSVVLDLLQGLSTSIGRCLIAWDQRGDGPARVERSISAYTHAIEGVLGVASGSIHLVDLAMLHAWGEALAVPLTRAHTDGCGGSVP